MTDNLQTLKEQVLEFVDRMWSSIDIPAEFTVSDYTKFVSRAYSDLIAGKEKSKVLIRLSGQSGSGKSTQLLPAALEGFRAHGISPIVIAVRYFASYHPFYTEIVERFGADKVRENTNKFALVLLFFTLEKLIQNGWPIILDIALLAPCFEGFITELLLEHSYKFEYHIMAVSRCISDGFIEKRQRSIGVEGNRYVARKSADYFYESMPPALEYLKSKCPVQNCILWSAFDTEPALIGKIGDVAVLETLHKYRAMDEIPDKTNEEELRQAKIRWFTSNVIG